MWMQDLMQGKVDMTVLVAIVVCIFAWYAFDFFLIKETVPTKPINPPTAKATTLLDDADDTVLVKITPSLALRIISLQRADLLRRILSFHEMRNPKDYIDLRSSSKLFHRALQPPPPLWTSYPHSKHATLQSLVDRLEGLRGDEESNGNVPSVLLIDEGEIGQLKRMWVTVTKPLSIYGAGRRKTTLVGFGLRIKGKKSDGIVEIEDLTIKEGFGLNANEGMDVIMRGCSVEECNFGVSAYEADISCDDLQVVGCGGSGVIASANATITLSGMGTSIQGNGTNGRSYYYGLQTSDFFAKIKLVAPLNKEQISTNNGGGGNWGGRGTIE